jgi:hypothetical protein
VHSHQQGVWSLVKVCRSGPTKPILLTAKTTETTVMERKVASAVSVGVRRGSRGEEGRKIFFPEHHEQRMDKNGR